MHAISRLTDFRLNRVNVNKPHAAQLRKAPDTTTELLHDFFTWWISWRADKVPSAPQA